jgi:acyl carrier protein
MEKLMWDLKKQIIVQLNLQDITPEDIDNEESLFGKGLGLDSIDALELIAILQDDYKVKLGNPGDGPKVLQSVKSMAEYIIAYQQEANIA